MSASFVRGRRIVLGLFTVSLLGLRAPQELVQAEEPAARASWTVMVYSAADCNLEEEMVSNLEEMMEIGGDAKLNIIVLADRSPKGEKEEDADKDDKDADKNDADKNDDDQADEGDSSGYTNRGVGNLGNWVGGKLLRIDADHLHEIEDWGDTNMGDPAVLERFVRTAAKLYPADHYALILSDHGGGWTGACQDESSDDDTLSLNELVRALARSERLTGPLEMLGFDACLMGTLEVTQALAPFSKTFVASEDLVPGTGWNYVPLLRSLKKDPKSTGPSLGEVIADSFRDYFAKADRASGSEVTLSVINPALVQTIDRAVLSLSRSLAVQLQNTGPDAWRRIARRTARTLTFGGDGDDENSSSLLDLVHLTQELRKEFPNAPVAAACDAVGEAVRSAWCTTFEARSGYTPTGCRSSFRPISSRSRGTKKIRIRRSTLRSAAPGSPS